MSGRQHGRGLSSFHLTRHDALENVQRSGVAGRKDAFERATEDCRRGPWTGLIIIPPDSGGQQKRGACRAFAPRPKILLADEPTGNLDGVTGAQVIDLLFNQTSKSGTTLIIVTHDPGLAERCDRMVRLRDGRLE